MKHVLRWVVDLLAVLLLAALAAGAVLQGLGGWVRAFIVVPLVLIVPGYALMAAIFPGTPDREAGQFDAGREGLKDPRLRKAGVDGVERAVFSVLATIVVVPLVAVAAHFSPWGVTVGPIVAGIASLTVALSAVAVVRRARLHPDERYYPPMAFPVRGLAYTPNAATLGRRRNRSRVFNLALLVAILVFASSVGYAAFTPPESDGFTELSIDTPNVTADRQPLYPQQFDADEPETLPLVLSNHDGERVEYDLVVALQRIDGQGGNATVLEHEEITRRTIPLDDGETANLSVDVAPSMTGEDLRLVVLAFAGDAPAEPGLDTATQSLVLPITVHGEDVGDGGVDDVPASNATSATPGPSPSGATPAGA